MTIILGNINAAMLKNIERLFHGGRYFQNECPNKGSAKYSGHLPGGGGGRGAKNIFFG